MFERFFLSRGARGDVGEPFHPHKDSDVEPVLLTSASEQYAQLVGAYVMKAIALRGGTKIGVSAYDALIARLEQSVGPHQIGHCRLEAELALDWVEFGPQQGTDLRIPEQRVMDESDNQTKIVMVNEAMTSSDDILLQYFDDSQNSWPQVRFTPTGLSEADGDIYVVGQHALGDVRIALHHVRWLMRVKRLEPQRVKNAKILSFPFKKDHNEKP